VLVIDVAGASETGGGLINVTAVGALPEAATFDAGPAIAVVDEHRHRRLGPGHQGIGWIAKTGRIPLGYLGDKDKTASTFPFIDGTRWSIPGDRARIREDGRVELLGRDAATINSAGEKIFAEEVERALLTHPAVADVVVVGRPSQQWGEEVVGVVQLQDGSRPSDRELLEAAAQHIARFKLPKVILRVGAVQRSPAGKADYNWARVVATANSSGTQP
jgi:fatty-acyl-CoA synthase